MAAPCVRSTMTRSLRLLNKPVASTSPCMRNLSSSARLCRPPSQPVAAEPAIVKAPHDPPNPAAWPGKQKARPEHQGSSNSSQSASSSKSPFEDLQGPWSAPSSSQAESSKAAQARATASGSDSITLEEPSRPKKSSEEPACSTLSPSSPAGPRTQSSLDKGKGKQEADTAKALPPEETKKPAAGAASATKSAATGKLFRAKKAALSLVSLTAARAECRLSNVSTDSTLLLFPFRPPLPSNVFRNCSNRIQDLD